MHRLHPRPAETAHVYPQSAERMGPLRRPGKVAGLVRIGVNLQRLPPGTRSSWPHAEENEEEFVYVLEGKSTPGSMETCIGWSPAIWRVSGGDGNLPLLHQ
jgi:uncharacterized cupin superfamily protein